MAVYVSEHAQTAGAHFRQQTIGPPLVSYSLSSGSTPALPNSLSNYIRVSADAGSLLSFNSTSTTALTLTSTNAVRIPANASPELFSLALSPSSSPLRIQCSST